MQDRIPEVRLYLMAYAVQWLAEWAGQSLDALPAGLPTGARDRLEPYLKLLRGDRIPTSPGSPLLSILSRVQAEASTQVPSIYWSARTLPLQPIALTSKAKARGADRAGLWTGFVGELGPLWEQFGDETTRFEVVEHLLHRWAWAVPCSYGEAGISLYDEFHALSALVHVSGGEAKPRTKFLCRNPSKARQSAETRDRTQLVHARRCKALWKSLYSSTERWSRADAIRPYRDEEVGIPLRQRRPDRLKPNRSGLRCLAVCAAARVCIPRQDTV